MKHRAALETDLEGLALPPHRAALVDLARALADELDIPRSSCAECGGHPGPDPRIVLRYADVLDSLGIGSVPVSPPKDSFQTMLEEFNARRPAAPHPAQ